jgi:acyl-coenzyme A thioesterase 13
MEIVSIDADQGIVELILDITDKHLNGYGNLHGGMTALLVDWAGSLAISVKTNSYLSGVSTNMQISFIRSATKGDRIHIRGTCNSVGKTLGFTTVTIHCNGKIIATGNHSKYLQFKSKL